LAIATDELGPERRVLLVDDDPDIREMYGARLSADGFDVSFAADGHQALAAATGRPAMILLDLHMPGPNGIEVLGRLKRNAATAEVPVVMLSNDGDSATKALCAEAGAADWWSKCRVTPAELSRRVSGLLGLATSPA